MQQYGILCKSSQNEVPMLSRFDAYLKAFKMHGVRPRGCLEAELPKMGDYGYGSYSFWGIKWQA